MHEKFSSLILSLFFLSLLSFTGSPLQFYVDYMNSGNVSAYGPGLIHGTVNKPAVFTVNTKDAGEGMHQSYGRKYRDTEKAKINN